MIRVMIVAAYSEVRDGLGTVLRLVGGVEITGAADGPEGALEQARAGRPDAALIDLEMPRGGGCETLRRLRRLCPGVKTIAITAHDYPAARQSALDAGADAVLVKGVEPAEMVAAIAAALRRAEAGKGASPRS